MLDQSFSVENFRIILDVENRKGINLESRSFFNEDVFKSSRKKIDEIKSINDTVKKMRKLKNSGRISIEDFYLSKDILDSEKLKCKEEKEDILRGILNYLAEFVNLKDYSLKIRKTNIFNGNQLYEIAKNPEDYLVLKQLQRNIYKTFDVMQRDRKLIISQLSTLVKDSFPKLIIRTDIKKFYENIPHKLLLSKIEENNLLSYPSKKIIKDILNQYWKLVIEDNVKKNTDERVGIPRGIGVSAYLSELYLRDIDKKINSLPNVAYYSRYVDDIIVIVIPNYKREETTVKFYLDEIREIIKKAGLDLNEADAKTNWIDLRNITEPLNKSFTYLGYRFNIEYVLKDTSKPDDGVKKNKIEVLMSDNKLDNYKTKIKLSFEEYKTEILKYSGKESASKKRLLQRITFLSTNTKLLSRKSNVMVGIFFSNQFLSNPYNDLKILDEKIKQEIALLPIGTCPKLIDKLNQISFSRGFIDKTLTKFSTNSLEKIVKIWKNI